ncbi:MAG: hypothetical protein MUF42_11765 [Cytophagaceae bacterium]|jgi:photosystem II stability/assembly factor-like uncharacterized protein|nr:hypothetical protein [Cytophagaceae bacterium]
MNKNLVLFSILLYTINSFGQWRTLNFTSNTAFNAVKVLNDDTIYAGGYGVIKPLLIKSTDGGESWKDIAPNVIGNIFDIQFLNSSTGYILTTANNCALMKTTDGGTSWTAINIPFVPYFFSKIYIKSATEVYVYGGSSCYSTKDGVNWTPQAYFDNDVTSIHFSSEEIGFATTNSGDLYRTANGGVSWLKSKICNYPLRSIKFTSDNIGFAHGDGFILISVNGGLAWNKLYSNIYHNVPMLNFFGENIMSGGAYISNTNGKTFKKFTGIINEIDVDVSLSNAYAVSFPQIGPIKIRVEQTHEALSE